MEGRAISESWVAPSRATRRLLKCNALRGILLVNRNQEHRTVMRSASLRQWQTTIPVLDGSEWFLGGLRAGTRAFQTIRKASEVKTMEDLLNLATLICALIGAMAFSILAAYEILRMGFALIHRQPRPATVKVQKVAQVH